MTEPEKHIVVIGGGIIGCTSAYFLTRHPKYDPIRHKITLLESTTIAGGASGKAGGLLALWAYPREIVPLSYRVHKQLADEHGGAKRWGYREVHCGQIECKGRPIKSGDTVNGKTAEMDGTRGALNNEKEHVSLQKRSKEAMGRLRAAGVPDDLDWIVSDTVGGYEAMSAPPESAQVHPHQFTNAMAELAQEAGADIRLGAHVKSLKYSSDGKTITGLTYEDKLNGNKIVELDATDVVLSAGPWTPRIYEKAPISALRAHSVTIRPTRPVSAYVLFTQIRLPADFSQTKESQRFRGHGQQLVTPEIYARPDSEVYCCGEGDELVDLPAGTDEVMVDEQRCQDVVDYASSISDELRDGQVTSRQACYLPNVTRGNGPFIGPTKVKGLLLCTGHTCWGIQNGPGSGKLISEFVFDGQAKSANVKRLDPRLVL